MIAFNEEKAILSSLKSILNQEGLENYEIIVINDASTDSTASVVKQFSSNHNNIKLINNEKNMGRGFSRRNGVLLASGKYVAFIDADVILPSDWLKTCEAEIKTYDAVGGIAIPDGDVCYVYRVFNLTPKDIKHTTSITGNNGFFRSTVLNSVGYDSTMRDGEDVDLSWKLENAGFKTKSIQNLICKHNEYKSFKSSLTWLYEQGIGSNRLLARFNKIRLPDLTFFGFAIVLLFSIIGLISSPVFILFPFLFCILVSVLHLRTKFTYLPLKSLNYFGAVIINSLMVAAYMIGRLSSLRLLWSMKKI